MRHLYEKLPMILLLKLCQVPLISLILLFVLVMAMAGGEGLVDTVITGPGKVYLQTMTVADLAKLIIPFIPEKK